MRGRVPLLLHVVLLLLIREGGTPPCPCRVAEGGHQPAPSRMEGCPKGLLEGGINQGPSIPSKGHGRHHRHDDGDEEGRDRSKN